jgi:hypothetical protein
MRAAVTNIVMVALEYRIDLSRLKVRELDKINRISDRINIVFIFFFRGEKSSN